jgi:rhodanese-related sulfurtransferase
MRNNWLKTGYLSNGVINLSPRQSYDLSRKGAVIVDVRESYMNSFKMFNVEKVIYMPFSGLQKSYPDLPVDKPLIFADVNGSKSRESVLFMYSKGYENVASMAGGMDAWEREGLPLTNGKSVRTPGFRTDGRKTGFRIR